MRLFRELFPEAFLAHLWLWNQSTLSNINPEYIGPLQPSKLDDERAIILAFQTVKETDDAICHGIVIGGRVFAAAVYNRECRTRQCFNCYKYRHFSPQCTNQTCCGKCAKTHAIPLKDDTHNECCKKDPDKCAVCSRIHPAWSKDCKYREQKYEHIRVARLATPMSYGSSQKKAQVSYFEDDIKFQIVQSKKKRANMAKRTDLTSDGRPVLDRQRAHSLMEKRRSRSPISTSRILTSMDTNIRSKTRSGKFGIYSERDGSSSQQSGFSDSTSSSQRIVDVEMQVPDSQFSQ